MELNNDITSIFEPNRKCIINADLDGLISGMILNRFLDWEIVGFSSCCGRPDDELWLYDINEDITECVFVDLPVCINSCSAVDQHFVAFDMDSVEHYNNDRNKANPNIIKKRVLSDGFVGNQYTRKYPFGTVHFIIAVLEKMGIIDDGYSFDFDKRIDDFELADLILRADRVIGNTVLYTPNCNEWNNWLVAIGGKNTKRLFYEIVRNEMINEHLNSRRLSEIKVGQRMNDLGCKKDGDCSSLLRYKNYDRLKVYFNYLAQALDMEPIPLYILNDFGKLNGKQYRITRENLSYLKEESLKENVFSFAFTFKDTLSITYITGDN